MADGIVLRDINKTIKKLLQQNITELSDDAAIIFDSPGDIEDSNSTRLIAFLYHIIENSHMRNTPPIYPSYTEKQPTPLILDLYFMFVPYAKTRETEIIVMEKLMQIFYDNAVLRGDLLEDGLTSSGNDEIRIVPQTLSLDDLHKLWSTFQNKSFRLSKSYIITPVRVPSERREDVTRVTEKIITSASIN